MPGKDWSQGVHSLKPGSKEAIRQELNNMAAPIEQPEPGEKIRRVVSPIYAGSALVADPALIENTPAGPMPRIADDGRTPMQRLCAANAAPSGKNPRIAIVIAGFGISAKATDAALGALPAAVTSALRHAAGTCSIG